MESGVLCPLCRCFIEDTMGYPLEHGHPIKPFLRLTDRKLRQILPAIYDLIRASVFSDTARPVEILQVTNHLKLLGVEMALIHKAAGELRNQYLLEWYSYKLSYIMNTIGEIHHTHSSGQKYISGFNLNITRDSPNNSSSEAKSPVYILL